MPLVYPVPRLGETIPLPEGRWWIKYEDKREDERREVKHALGRHARVTQTEKGIELLLDPLYRGQGVDVYRERIPVAAIRQVIHMG